MTSTPAPRCLLPLLALTVAMAAMPAVAITVNTSGVMWPSTAEVATSPVITPFGFTDVANSGAGTLAQTFQVGTTFDAESLYVIYGGDSSADFSVGLTVFSVADVFSDNLTLTPDPADILLDTTFLAPVESDETIMQIFLDSPLTLPATTGTAGYALRFTNEDEFRWERSGSSGGNPYAFGVAYENGAAKTGSGVPGVRDFSLAISSEGIMSLIDVPAVQSGDLNAASTWSTNAAPTSDSRYLIGDTFTATANSTSFNGGQAVVQSGGSLDLAVSGVVIDGVDVPGLVVEAGGTLTESVTGDFAIGDIGLGLANLSRLELNGTANFAASPGADLFVDVDLSGTGDLNFASNGAGSDMFLSAAEGHTGTIRFNGTGDAVRLTEEEGFGTLEMNSTGANQLVYDGIDTAGGTAVIFNQPGTIVHSSTADRLQTTGQLVANADVQVDVSTTFVGNERRMFFGDGLSGAGNITLTGTATDPTSGSTTRNEFELGTSSEPADAIVTNDYSGTLTANGFIDVEVRLNQPDASIVINNNATLEMGHQEIFTEFNVELGEVLIASGGTLVVGYEADGKHNPYRLIMSDDGTRDGDLTLASGSRTVMQVNGTNAEDYDRIVSEGDVSVDGALEILVNPEGDQSGFEASNGIFINTYAPTLGDTFDLISVVADPLAGDYNADGTVDSSDYAVWAADFGSTTLLAADGNGDGVVDAADYTIYRDNEGQTAAIGSLSGTFSSLVVTDPGGVMSAAGLAFQLNYTATSVQLEVVALGVAVPEPGSAALLIGSVITLTSLRRRSTHRQAHPSEFLA